MFAKIYNLVHRRLRYRRSEGREDLARSARCV